MTNFLDKWARSPRQDRRVVVNGKFVELTPPQIEKPVEEEQETALERVYKKEVPIETNGTASTGADVSVEVGNGSNGVESAVIAEVQGRTTDQNEEIVGGLSVPATSEASLSETLQAELEPIDAVAEHFKGSQGLAEIVEAATKAELEPIVQVYDEIIYELPPIPEESLKSIQEAMEAGNVLSGAVIESDGSDVLPEATGRVGEVEDIDDGEIPKD